jgi:nitrous oxidase accessory protein NosD
MQVFYDELTTNSMIKLYFGIFFRVNFTYNLMQYMNFVSQRGQVQFKFL